jgi:hypothetical protein
MAEQSSTGIEASSRFRPYSDELRQRFCELSAAFCDCQRTFTNIIDMHPEGPAVGSTAQLELEHLQKHDLPTHPEPPSLIPVMSYFYLSTVAEHLGGLGALYAAEEVAYPHPCSSAPRSSIPPTLYGSWTTRSACGTGLREPIWTSYSDLHS